jgi:glycosyltransferase involved in cell wall biosynthesis
MKIYILILKHKHFYIEMLKHNYKISIIIPTFNSEKVLAAAIQSVLNQSFTDFEVLIIDGISTDDTLNIAKNYADSRIKIFSEKDKGIYDAMNKGTEKAQGEWLYFLGSDDVLIDNYILKRIFEDNKRLVETADFIYGNVLLGDTNKVYGGYRDVFMLYKKNVCHQACFVKKNVLLSKGLFDLKYKIMADYHFNLLCFTDNNIRKTYIDTVVARYAIDGASAKQLDIDFSSEIYDLFVKNVKNLSPEIFVKFKVMYANRKGLKNNLIFIKNSILLYLIKNKLW